MLCQQELGVFLAGIEWCFGVCGSPWYPLYGCDEECWESNTTALWATLLGYNKVGEVRAPFIHS